MATSHRATTPFFLLAFAITWGLQLPGVLAQRGILPGAPNHYMPFVVLGIFGPIAAASWLSFREGGKPELKRLFGQLLLWKVHPAWYVAALALPGLLLTAMLFGLNLAGRQGPIHYFPAASGIVLAVVISVAEEVGWRGYALPRLQERWGAFGASAALGVVWYLWHIPMFLGSGVPMDLVLVMLLYFVGGSLLFTWIYNGTGGSLMLVVFAHIGAHLNNSHKALPEEVLPLVAHAMIYAALGLFVMRAKNQFRPVYSGSAKQ